MIHPYNQYTGKVMALVSGQQTQMIWYTLRYALERYYNDKTGWKGLVKSAMNTDKLGSKQIQYEQLYYSIRSFGTKYLQYIQIV